LLATGTQRAGEHSMTWDLHDEGGRTVDPGLYFARLEVQGRTFARKIVATR
jgi:hypothetical protein